MGTRFGDFLRELFNKISQQIYVLNTNRYHKLVVDRSPFGGMELPNNMTSEYYVMIYIGDFGPIKKAIYNQRIHQQAAGQCETKRVASSRK